MKTDGLILSKKNLSGRGQCRKRVGHLMIKSISNFSLASRRDSLSLMRSQNSMSAYGVNASIPASCDAV